MTKEIYTDKKVVNKYVRLYRAECLAMLKKMPDNFVDAIVTDPPYGLGKAPDALEMLKDWIKTGHHDVKAKSGFMGKAWDSFIPQPLMWKEALRVLKPGGHILCFAGTRTMDLMCLSLRLAGFELRDSIGYAHDGGGAPLLAWTYGSGFPKSLNIGKAIDKSSGAKRKVIGKRTIPGYAKNNVKHGTHKRNKTEFDITSKEPVTELAKKYNGYGTALKPAWEPIILARKPFSESTAAKNVMKHGTGGLNIDGCRIATNPDVDDSRLGGKGKFKTDKAAKNVYEGGYTGNDIETSKLGRFPANLIHDGSDDVISAFPSTKPSKSGGRGSGLRGHGRYGKSDQTFNNVSNIEDSGGSAARFFYCAKTNKKDRSEGCDNHTLRAGGCYVGNNTDTQAPGNKLGARPEKIVQQVSNNHPTVKPTELMRYLVRLVTPENGIVLDPFMGSGSTGKACMLEGFRFVGIEREKEYFPICVSRIKHAHKQRVKDCDAKKTARKSKKRKSVK